MKSTDQFFKLLEKLPDGTQSRLTESLLAITEITGTPQEMIIDRNFYNFYQLKNWNKGGFTYPKSLNHYYNVYCD